MRIVWLELHIFRQTSRRQHGPTAGNLVRKVRVSVFVILCLRCGSVRLFVCLHVCVYEYVCVFFMHLYVLCGHVGMSIPYPTSAQLRSRTLACISTRHGFRPPPTLVDAFVVLVGRMCLWVRVQLRTLVKLMYLRMQQWICLINLGLRSIRLR